VHPWTNCPVCSNDYDQTLAERDGYAYAPPMCPFHLLASPNADINPRWLAQRMEFIKENGIPLLATTIRADPAEFLNAYWSRHNARVGRPCFVLRVLC